MLFRKLFQKFTLKYAKNIEIDPKADKALSLVDMKVPKTCKQSFLTITIKITKVFTEIHFLGNYSRNSHLNMQKTWK